MRRREIITLVGSRRLGRWRLRAQQPDRVRRIRYEFAPDAVAVRTRVLFRFQRAGRARFIVQGGKTCAGSTWR